MVRPHTEMQTGGETNGPDRASPIKVAGRDDTDHI
jgi:hypothetical protein